MKLLRFAMVLPSVTPYSYVFLQFLCLLRLRRYAICYRLVSKPFSNSDFRKASKPIKNEYSDHVSNNEIAMGFCDKEVLEVHWCIALPCDRTRLPELSI